MSELASGIANVFGILIVLVGFAASLTWIERRLLGLFQDRHGPNRVGPFGVLQIVADMIKILFKEDWIPPFADRVVFVLAPMIVMAALLIALPVMAFPLRGEQILLALGQAPVAAHLAQQYLFGLAWGIAPAPSSA